MVSVSNHASSANSAVASIAREFSPRYECHRDDLVSIDVSGLERLFRRRSVLDTPERSACGSSEREGASEASGGGAPRSVWKTIGEELRREAASRGVRVHVAVAATRMAAVILAHARPGVTIVELGDEAEALASIPIGVLGHVTDLRRSVLDTPERSACGSSEREGASEASGGGAPRVLENGARASGRGGGAPREVKKVDEAIESALSSFKAWGLKTLGELAALPSADLASRLGRQALAWQALARGEDVRPLVPTLEDERFESSLELEWPIEGLEPLSFVLTRLLEPLSTRLERRDRGAAVLHVILRLVTKDFHARRLELPAPMRDVRTLRTLALLDLESHPPAAAIDRVAIVIDPTPGRVLQHALFTRAQPTPEQLSTLLARLGALMGQDRLGAPAVVDSYRPGAFAMAPFKTEHESNRGTRRERGETSHVSDTDLRRPVLDTREGSACGSSERERASEASGGGAPRALENAPSASARDSLEPLRGASAPSNSDGDGVPVAIRKSGAPREVKDIVSALRRCRHPVPARVAVDNGRPVRVTTDRRGFVGGNVVQCAGPWRTSGDWWEAAEDRRRPVLDTREGHSPSASGAGVGPRASERSWNRDEWDVALTDGAVYRIFQDRDTDAWFIDAIVD